MESPPTPLATKRRPRAARRLATGWLLALCTGLAQAQPAQPAPPAEPAGQPLLAWEQEAITLARPSDAWLTVWQRLAVHGEQADEFFRRAALLSRCLAVARHDAPFLEAELREGIEQVAERYRAIFARHEGPAAQRWRYGSALAAYRSLAGAERARLLAVVRSEPGQRARQWQSAVAVLELFPDHARAFDGRLEPARVPWLRTYLQAEGVWPAVLRTLRAVDPDTAERWAALPPLPELRPTDADALRQLHERIAARLPKVTAALQDHEMPLPERQAFQDLKIFWAAVLNKLTSRWPLAGPAPLPPDAPQPPPGEAAEPDAPGYAMPEALERELLRVGPMQLAKGALPRSCAP